MIAFRKLGDYGTWTRMALLIAVAAPSHVIAQDAGKGARSAAVVMQVRNTTADETLHITVGQSVILSGNTPMKRVFVGNPAVLQSFNSSAKDVMLTAKAPGVSSLAMWDVEGRARLYTVSVDVDPTAMRLAVREMYPETSIDVQGVEDRIALNGEVATAEIADSLVKLGGSYAKQVANSLRIVAPHPKQVELKLQIIEVDRTRLDQFGVNFASSGKVPASTSTGAFTDPLNLSVGYLKENITLNIQALAQLSILQILAEPTLTTISGQAARFLSGGEFPVPVAQAASANGSGTAITIQFRPYGVKVDFVPTVGLDGSILLKVAPEVSTLDYANAVTISGFTVPALATRRAETEIELKDGQSFVLSGLLDHRTVESFGRVPGIARVPVLGQLFRSKNNTHSVTELVFVVTAHVVDPLHTAPEVDQPVSVHPNMSAQQFDESLQRQHISAPPR